VLQTTLSESQFRSIINHAHAIIILVLWFVISAERLWYVPCSSINNSTTKQVSIVLCRKNVSDLSTTELFKARLMIRQIGSPIISIFGLCGNVLSVLALRKSTMTATTLLLTSLSCADSLTLLYSVLIPWILLLGGYDLRKMSNFICKLDLFLTYFWLQLSPWMLVLITCQRVYCVLKPARVHVVFTVKRT